MRTPRRHRRFRNAKRAEPLRLQPFSLARVGLEHYERRLIQLCHCGNVDLLGRSIPLNHVVLVVSQIPLPICCRHSSSRSVAYVHETNGHKGARRLMLRCGSELLRNAPKLLRSSCETTSGAMEYWNSNVCEVLRCC